MSESNEEIKEFEDGMRDELDTVSLWEMIFALPWWLVFKIFSRKTSVHNPSLRFWAYFSRGIMVIQLFIWIPFIVIVSFLVWML